MVTWIGKKDLGYKCNVVVYFSYATWIRAFCNCWSSFTVSVTQPSIKSTEPKRNVFLSSILFTKASATLISFAFASATRILSFFNSPVQTHKFRIFSSNHSTETLKHGPIMTLHHILRKIVFSSAIHHSNYLPKSQHPYHMHVWCQTLIIILNFLAK